MLDLKEVRKYYSGPGEMVHAVDGASLTTREGELVAIFGPSGSGKTTLLLLAAGVLHPDSGTVSFDGRSLSTLSKREVLEYRRRELGFIFQMFNLVPGLSAKDNVILPLLLDGRSHREAERKALSALDSVGLGNRAKHRPNQLSGGEQQRVAIARALAGEPSLVLADEPTGNLDTHRGDEVLSLLRALSRERGTAVVLVTHDSRATGYADHVLEMHDGKLVNHGPSNETVTTGATS